MTRMSLMAGIIQNSRAAPESALAPQGQVRPGINAILENAPDLSPAKPSEEELLEILSMPAAAQTFDLVSCRTLLTGWPQTLLDEPRRKPFLAAKLPLPAQVLPSIVFSPTWTPLDIAALNAIADAPDATEHQRAAEPLPPAAARTARLVAFRGQGPASNTRSEAQAKRLAALPRARRLPGASSSSRGPA